MKVETKTIKTYKPTKLDILILANVGTMKGAHEVLGVDESTLYTWIKKGMSRKIAVKYFGEEYINNLED